MMDLRIDHLKRRISDDSSTVAKRRKSAEPDSPSKGLAHLPEEVLLIILDVILGKLVRCGVLGEILQHVKTLHSLCLTNSTFNRLATPYLCAFISNRNRRTLTLALDAMILDSKKAEGIKFVSWALDVKRSSQAMCRRSPQAVTIFLQKLGRLGIPELADSLRQCFHGDSPEYHLATALVLAPNLEYLEAADVNYGEENLDGDLWRPTWLELLSLKVLSSPPGLCRHFQRLRHLHLGMGELSFEQIGPLLRLPALRVLHLVGNDHSGRISANPWNKEVSEGCSTIQTLIFEHCRVSSEIVAQVMNAIKQLKVLKLEMAYWFLPAEEHNEGSNAQQLSWSTLNTAIAKHRESLERLYLIESNNDFSGAESFGAGFDLSGQMHLECLRDMHQLRYLDTGLQCIETQSSTILPDSLLPNLEHMVIEVEGERDLSINHFQRALQDLATHCRSRLPLLQDIVVWLPRNNYVGSWLLEPDFSACKAAFGSQGVDIIILAYSGMEKKRARWQLHPSTAKKSSLLASDSGWCALHSASWGSVSGQERAQVVFHESCNAYHHPYGWSIIDNLAVERS